MSNFDELRILSNAVASVSGEMASLLNNVRNKGTLFGLLMLWDLEGECFYLNQSAYHPWCVHEIKFWILAFN